jgi:transposase
LAESDPAVECDGLAFLDRSHLYPLRQGTAPTRAHPTMSKRRTHSPEFKTKVAMEAISGRKTHPQIAADHGCIHPGEPVEKQVQKIASDFFSPGKKSRDKDEMIAKESGLFQQVGRLQMELQYGKLLGQRWHPDQQGPCLQSHAAHGIADDLPESSHHVRR